MNLYEILELDNNCTEVDIKNAYKRLAKLYHPDKNNHDTTEKFKNINIAYDVLKDKNKRARYDAMSNVEKFKFYDIIKQTILHMDPNKRAVIENVINFFFNSESELKADFNKMDFNSILYKINHKLENVNITDIGNIMSIIGQCTNTANIDNNKSTDYYTNHATNINKNNNDPNIRLQVTTTIEDRYMSRYKKVVYKTNRNTDTVYVPLYNTDMIFPNKGNYFNDMERGDLYVDIVTEEHDSITIINNHDLMVTEYISLYEYLYGFNKQLRYMGEYIYLQTETFVDKIPQIKYTTKGLPYKNIVSDEEYVNVSDTESLDRGNLIVYFKIKDLGSMKNIIKNIEE